MDIRKRFTRRPVAAALWLAILMAMSSLLTLGAQMLYAATQLPALLSQTHTTVAVSKSKPAKNIETEWGMAHQQTDMKLREDDVSFLLSLDSVHSIDYRSISFAYSPELKPKLVYRDTPWGPQEAYYMANHDYTDTMAVITVDNIVHWADENYMGPFQNIYLEATIEEFVSINDGLLEFEQLQVGKPILLYLSVQDSEDEIMEQTIALQGKHLLCFGTLNPIESGGINLSGSERTILAPDISVPSMEQRLHGDTLIARQSSSSNVDYDTLPVTVENGWFPCFVPLEGSVEDFLADPNNQLWADMLEITNIRHQCVAVMGTDNLKSMHSFVTGDCGISQGRDFSPEELENGARVCILSETVATESGLQVGDTIHLSQYNPADDWIHPDIDGILAGPKTIGYLSYDSSAFVRQDEPFTVVGIYRMDDILKSGEYTYTVNTVFIPNRAQAEGALGGVSPKVVTKPAPPELGGTITGLNNELTQGIYLSVILKNGSTGEFLEALNGTNLEDHFIVVSTGYENAVSGVEALISSTGKIFGLCVLGWLLLAGLYLLLGQGSQRRDLGIMRLLGTEKQQVRRYLFGSGLVLAAVGIGLGLLLGVAMGERVQSILLTLAQDQSEALAVLEQAAGLPVPLLALLSLGQVGIMALLLWVQAKILCDKRPRDILGL